MSSIVWTTLPVSIDAAGNGHVSVFVSPKLDAATSPQWPFANWSSVMNGATFAVNVFDTVNSTPASVVTATVQNGTFDKDLWAAIFPAQGVAVNGFKFQDNGARQLWSYPVDVVHENIKSMYASVQSTNATAMPTIDPTQQNPLMALISSYAQANAERVGARQSLGIPKWIGNWAGRNTAELAALNAIPVTAAGSVGSALTPLQKAVWLAKRFYDRPTPRKDQHNNLTGVGPVLAPPTWDFNERIGMLSDHPYLLRRLGLLIDLQFTWSGPATGFLQVVPTWDPNTQFTGTNVIPRTAFSVVGQNLFVPMGSTSDSADAADVVNGMVPLSDTSRYYVTTGDPDGTMHKTIDFASNMTNLVAFMTQDAAAAGTTLTPPQEGLPARRNNGITVTRKGRGAVLTSRFNRVKNLETSFDSNKPADLYAQDITRGYRVDVLSGGAAGTWSSLHQRTTTYVVNGAVLSNTPSGNGQFSDEGYMKSASGTSDSDPTGPNDLYVHEKLFGWHGWSLSASRPGKQIMPDSTTAAPNNAPTDPTLPVTTVVRVAPGTLPSLRYGQSYQVRARAVDLGGNSLALKDPGINPSLTTAPVPFGRVEPVPPPVLVYTSAVTEGESLETLVIRSDPANPHGAVNAALMAHNLNVAYQNTTTNPLQFTDQPNPYKIYAPYNDRHIAAPKEPQYFAEMHGDFDGAFFNGATLDQWYRLGTREEGTFMDTRVADLNDPSNNGYIANPNNPIVVRPPQVPADQPPPVPSAGSVVANRGDALAAGEYVICQPTSNYVMTPYLPDSMAGGGVVWDPSTNANAFSWTYAGGAANDYTVWPNYPTFRMRIAEGTGTAPTYSQSSNEGPAMLIAQLPPATITTLRYASTPRADRLNHLEYVQDYNPQDNLTDGRHWMVSPGRTITLIHAVQRPLAAPHGSIAINRNWSDTFASHTLSLTTHSRSTGQVDMQGAWTEYIDDLTNPGPQQNPTTGRAYSVSIAYGQDSLVQRSLKHEFGDTKHRIVSYTPTGTTRYKVFFPPGIINDSTQISVAGTAPSAAADGTYSIPSSARPHAPKVAYIVPTFAWSQPASGTSVRSGNGLRIYLERPWYSSGQGEVLGVIVAPASGSPTPTALPYVSMWGRDPVWDSAANGAMTSAAFNNPGGAAVTCTLVENGQSVTVLPLSAPVYHPQKQLWYVDVDMAPGQTYFPFVSLSLVRYQPSSLTGVEISKVTRADFAQLVPDRTFQTAAISTGAIGVTVTGVAAENLYGSTAPKATQTLPAGYIGAPASHFLQASIQERQAGSVGAMGWNTIGTSVTLLGKMPVGGGTATWTGTLAVPAATTGAERRVIVEEYEVFVADPLNNNVQYFTPTGSRLVYVDMMPVPTFRIIITPPILGLAPKT